MTKTYTLNFDHLRYHFAFDWMVLSQDLKSKEDQKKGSKTKEFVGLNVGEQKLLTRTSL